MLCSIGSDGAPERDALEHLFDVDDRGRGQLLSRSALTSGFQRALEEEEHLAGGLARARDLAAGLVTNFLADLGDAEELVDRQRGEHRRDPDAIDQRDDRKSIARRPAARLAHAPLRARTHPADAL